MAFVFKLLSYSLYFNLNVGLYEQSIKTGSWLFIQKKNPLKLKLSSYILSHIYTYQLFTRTSVWDKNSRP
jgi:hypothetical protein